MSSRCCWQEGPQPWEPSHQLARLGACLALVGSLSMSEGGQRSIGRWRDYEPRAMVEHKV